MPHTEFWYGKPILAKYYREADEQKRARENQVLWLQGLYNFKAFNAALENLAYCIGACKGQRPEGYISKPIAVTESEIKAEKEERIRKTLEFFKNGQAGEM